MSALEHWIQRHWAALLLWLLAGGFVMVLAELLLAAHTDGVQLVGVVASGVGLLLTLAALAVGRRARYTVAVLLLVLSVTGLLGTLQHFQARAENDDARSEQRDESKGVPPPLAPLSLSGLGLMAVIATLGSGKPRT
jgi:hypothetical protein